LTPRPMSIVRIVIAEDFAAFRRAICSILEKGEDLEVVCEVGDGRDAVQKSEELKPELILLDIGLPTLNGLRAAREIRRVAPETKIIFVSQESSPDVVQEALALGANGYIAKARIGSDLLIAIDEVLQGRRFVSSNLKTDRPS